MMPAAAFVDRDSSTLSVHISLAKPSALSQQQPFFRMVLIISALRISIDCEAADRPESFMNFFSHIESTRFSFLLAPLLLSSRAYSRAVTEVRHLVTFR